MKENVLLKCALLLTRINITACNGIYTNVCSNSPICPPARPHARGYMHTDVHALRIAHFGHVLVTSPNRIIPLVSLCDFSKLLFTISYRSDSTSGRVARVETTCGNPLSKCPDVYKTFIKLLSAITDVVCLSCILRS